MTAQSSKYVKLFSVENCQLSVTKPFFYSTLDRYKGLFTNYVDKILTFFDHLPPYVVIFYGLNVDIFGSPSYLPRLVNVVCEQPLIGKLGNFPFFQSSK